jgi:hypothetical protein
LGGRGLRCALERGGTCWAEVERGGERFWLAGDALRCTMRWPGKYGMPRGVLRGTNLHCVKEHKE